MDDQLRALMEASHRIGGEDPLDRVLEMGDLVLSRQGGGGSLRSLARRLGLSSSTLSRAVAIVELCRELGRRSFAHLGVSHLKLLLPLPADLRRELMEQAEREGWTVSRLRAHIERRIRPSRRLGYRSALSHLSTWRGQLRRLDGISDRDIDADEARRILELVRSIRMDLEMMEIRLVNVAGRLGR